VRAGIPEVVTSGSDSVTGAGSGVHARAEGPAIGEAFGYVVFGHLGAEAFSCAGDGHGGVYAAVYRGTGGAITGYHAAMWLAVNLKVYRRQTALDICDANLLNIRTLTTTRGRIPWQIPAAG
jgi:hypothetical protein